MDRLQEILSTMKIPESRKTCWSWLLRNLWIQNSDHKDIVEAMNLVKQQYKDWIRPKQLK